MENYTREQIESTLQFLRNLGVDLCNQKEVCDLAELFKMFNMDKK